MITVGALTCSPRRRRNMRRLASVKRLNPRRRLVENRFGRAMFTKVRW
jgi:hypothetical protein